MKDENKLKDADSLRKDRESFDKEHDLSHLSDEERQRMHDEYSKMGQKGGPIGGQKRAEELGHEGYQELGHRGGTIRAESMAKGEKTKK